MAVATHASDVSVDGCAYQLSDVGRDDPADPTDRRRRAQTDLSESGREELCREHVGRREAPRYGKLSEHRQRCLDFLQIWQKNQMNMIVLVYWGLTPQQQPGSNEYDISRPNRKPNEGPRPAVLNLLLQFSHFGHYQTIISPLPQPNIP